MSTYSFKTTSESQAFCDRVCQALCVFFGMSKERAYDSINRYWHDVECIDDDPLLFHEPPYFYAMCIGHHPTIGDNNLAWENDPRWWPPPEEWAR